MKQPGTMLAIMVAGIAIAAAIIFTNSSEVTVDADVAEIPVSGPILDDVITIGLIPVEKGQEPESEAVALKEFLEDELGVKVEITYTTGYEPLIEGIRFGHLDAAFMDAAPAWITHQRTGAEVVLAELVNGKVTYQATVWALEDNDSIKSLEDTVGKKVAFTSITGSSGFIRPVGTLIAEDYIEISGNDIVAIEDALVENFESHTFAGGYKAALELLLEGHVDVAFGSDIAPQTYLEPEDQSRLRAVATVGHVPSHVFMVHPGMADSTRDALVEALIRLNYDENNKILTDLYGADALVPTSTALHIRDFGYLIDNLTGLDQKILDKYNKSK
ncbi:MAG: phosphate/phosphite/phosphonate ABC transporter substrate-binding protein [Nitrosopumilus sp. H8]|nr:MAG: phosphate/phosphite/phosphonate ABC transporter substrate-binding protein [Nitrosopumilus sp. H8]